MNGLAGTRVIIVDDEEKDALPILQEFARRGIPTAFFGGTRRYLPLKNQRLSGVRLAILDMDLVGGGVSDKSKVSTLLAYLGKILKPDNGPYGVLAWTKHIDLVQLFGETVFAEPSIPNPIFTISLAKDVCTTKGKLNYKLISSKIGEALVGFSPLLVLQEWEEKCFLAATQVTNELSTLAASDIPTSLGEWRKLWNTQFLQLMHTMAAAEAGKKLDGNSCLSAFYGSLNPLHSDRMESNIPALRTLLSSHSAEIMAAAKSSDSRAKAKLNTMLHLVFEGVNNFYAGNIYIRKSNWLGWIPSVSKLLDDLMVSSGVQKRETKRRLVSVSKSIVIEVNAICDHAQNNVRIARFIAGLLVPVQERNNIKQAEYIHKLGPVFLDAPTLEAGEYYFYFSARHLLTVELDQVARIKAYARLRGQAFADLQAWFAHRAARPGMLMLTD